MRTFITVIFFIVCLYKVSAQDVYHATTYKKAIGVKLPGGFAVSYKQFVSDYQNAEAEVMFGNHGFRLVGLYEFNWDISGVDGLRWYAGAGAHLGFQNNNVNEKSINSRAGFGIDGVIGFDYKIADLPINVSLDWQPAVDLIGSTGNGAAYGGIGVRYTF